MAQKSMKNLQYGIVQIPLIIDDISELYSLSPSESSDLDVNSLEAITITAGTATFGSGTNTGNVTGVSEGSAGKGLKFTNNVNGLNYNVMGDKGHYTVVGFGDDFSGFWGVYGTNSKKIEINNATFNENITIDSSSANLFISGENISLSQTTDIFLGTLPTSSAGLSSGALFTQTGTQLGGSGSTKVICIV